MHLGKFAIPEIIFGRHALTHVGQCALRLGAKKVLLVSDPGIERAGWVKVLTNLLDKDGIKWAYYSNVSPNPRDYEIEKGATFYREAKADVILAIGGGSTLDTAKGIAILVSNDGKIADYEGANQVKRPLPPMLLITTTAGSGSDISQFCIITNVKRKVKMSIITRTLVPNISIVDPLLLTTKDKQQVIFSAVDALAHAVESYLSNIASPFTEIHSLNAVGLIVQHLPEAVATRSLESLEQLSIAAVSASIAFSNASLGVEHALAHALGGYFDMPHGVIHPILLPAIMRYNLDFAPEKMQQLGKVILQKQTVDAQTAKEGIARLEHFFRDLGVNTRLQNAIGSQPQELFEPICRMAVNDACVLTNPRPASWNELRSICEEVW